MRAVCDKYTTDKKDPDDEIPDDSFSVEEVLGEKNFPESRRSARGEGGSPPDRSRIAIFPYGSNLKLAARDSHNGYLSPFNFCYAVGKENANANCSI